MLKVARRLNVSIVGLLMGLFALQSGPTDARTKKPTPAKPSPSPMPSLELAATIGDQPISVAELDRTAGTRLLVLKSQEYALRSRVLRQEIERRLLEAEALRRSISVEDLLRSEVDAKLPAGDAQAPAPRSRMLAERRSEFLRELREKTGVWVFLEPPRIPVAIDPASPSRGPAEAAVTIVEFSDFQCPYCGRVEPTLKQLKDRYPGMIRFVFRDFPLPAHKQAPKAAEAAACADEQGKFWEMQITCSRTRVACRSAISSGTQANSVSTSSDSMDASTLGDSKRTGGGI